MRHSSGEYHALVLRGGWSDSIMALHASATAVGISRKDPKLVRSQPEAPLPVGLDARATLIRWPTEFDSQTGDRLRARWPT